MKREECIFCRIVAGTLPSKKLYEDQDLFAIEDLNPQAPTHILIFPKKHIVTSLDFTDNDREMIGTIFLVANRLAKERGIAEPGYRIVLNCNAAGGQTIYHLHFHLMGGRRFRWPPG
ncbi:MAG: histidine triad nucleotide-binding protein [Candidatus Tectomicrobia bacterium]|nr:histidine triad nucleotide-binding protein [Candidatus Tectomicrobia bacterium]